MNPSGPSALDGARCRPTVAQELLLTACLAEEGTAIAAWERWCTTTDLDRMDEESFRHLPLAWYRLQRLAPRSRTLDIAKGVYRQAWYRNQLLLRTVGSVLDALGDAGIDAMLLKGTSLATRYYPTPATRPMVDIDVLVPHGEAERAFAVLGRDGWRPVKQTPAKDLVGYAHAVSFVREQTNLDLHWNALWPQRTADADRPFWQEARRIDHQGRAAWALAPTDELFHTCMHGARRSQNAYSWAPLPLVRWITDAFMIARSCDIDWARIAALAERYHARLHMRDAFLCLRNLGFAVPDALLAGWAQVRSPADELHYELALTPRPPRFFAALPRFRFWKSYRMKTYIEQGANGADPVSMARRLAGFPPVRGRLRQGGPRCGAPARPPGQADAQARGPAVAAAALATVGAGHPPAIEPASGRASEGTPSPSPCWCLARACADAHTRRRALRRARCRCDRWGRRGALAGRRLRGRRDRAWRAPRGDRGAWTRAAYPGRWGRPARRRRRRERDRLAR